jgi:hypothetical protein
VNGAALTLRDEMDYDYEPPPEKREPVSARVPASLKERLLGVVRLWKIQAKVRGEKDHQIARVDLSHVVERLLKSGVDGVWLRAKETTGLDFPETEAEWAMIERAYTKLSAEAKKK